MFLLSVDRRLYGLAQLYGKVMDVAQPLAGIFGKGSKLKYAYLSKNVVFLSDNQTFLAEGAIETSL